MKKMSITFIWYDGMMLSVLSILFYIILFELKDIIF